MYMTGTLNMVEDSKAGLKMQKKAEWREREQMIKH